MRASKTLGVAVLLLVAACKPLTGLLPEKPADELALKRSTFAALEGWAGADVRTALAAFAGSCKRITARADGDALGGAAAYGSVREWREPCAAALQLKTP